MTTKTKNIINWSLAGLVGFIFIGSAMSKFFGGEETIQMAHGIGLSAETFRIIGLVEFLSAILFLIPRTGIIGTLLLAAYMGGAIATHLTHAQSLIAPAIIEAIIWIVALIRFPELKHRLLNTNK
ncbi:MAG: DoxX family protein [Bacteroidia bacterium]|nr:DoxX family protein [Bacteroidia bacterium]